MIFATVDVPRHAMSSSHPSSFSLKSIGSCRYNPCELFTESSPSWRSRQFSISLRFRRFFFVAMKIFTCQEKAVTSSSIHHQSQASNLDSCSRTSTVNLESIIQLLPVVFVSPRQVLLVRRLTILRHLNSRIFQALVFVQATSSSLQVIVRVLWTIAVVPSVHQLSGSIAIVASTSAFLDSLSSIITCQGIVIFAKLFRQVAYPCLRLWFGYSSCGSYSGVEFCRVGHHVHVMFPRTGSVKPSFVYSYLLPADNNSSSLLPPTSPGSSPLSRYGLSFSLVSWSSSKVLTFRSCRVIAVHLLLASNSMFIIVILHRSYYIHLTSNTRPCSRRHSVSMVSIQIWSSSSDGQSIFGIVDRKFGINFFKAL